MKKLMIVALAIFASASLSANTGDKKEKKNKKQAQTEQAAPAVAAPVVTVPQAAIVSENDSLIYAFGIAQGQQLPGYLSQQGVTEEFYQAFISGVLDGANSDDKEKSAYADGLQLGQMIANQWIPGMTRDLLMGDSTQMSKDIILAAFLSSLTGAEPLIEPAAANDYFEKKMNERKEEANRAYENENKQWLEDNANKPGVVVLPSGLQYKVITKGEGKTATIDDNVTVKYEGKMIDGTVFDSSYTRTPDTTSFRPSQVIKGWTEALCMMPEGSVWELYIPQELGYGSRAAGKIKPMSTLIFKVEVVKVGEE